MRRLPLASVILLMLSAPAFASANFACSAADEKVAVLAVEGLAGSEGNLVSFEGTLEIARGETFTLTKADVKAFLWQKMLALRIAKQTPRGLIEFHIEAKPKPDDETDLVGTYAVRAGRRTINGTIQCSGG